MNIYNPQRFFKAFPRLDKSVSPASPYDPKYNCIAWALGMNDRCWWPKPPDGYWPLGVSEETKISAFEAMFAIFGYEQCDSGRLEAQYEKIALYARNGIPTHAARQLRNGRWTSKCGSDIDIEHKLKDLEGPAYGKVALFFRRPLQCV